MTVSKVVLVYKIEEIDEIKEKIKHKIKEK
jgi:hypothetical protein